MLKPPPIKQRGGLTGRKLIFFFGLPKGRVHALANPARRDTPFAWLDACVRLISARRHDGVHLP